MAAEAPSSVDVIEYQFKLHDKLTIFGRPNEFKNDVNLLATASPFGLIFVGNPSQPEIKVVQLRNLVDAKETGEPVLARTVNLPGIPQNIAVSCDGSLLAVNFAKNGAALLAIYSVPSFLSANIINTACVALASDASIHALQILWNPVIAGTLAVVLSDGSLSVYNLKDTAYEFHSIDKAEQVKCASWSPKGKQIVVGFPHGKLVQYKPDLKPARIIACPPNIHEEPFNTIAIQWLSTYQFAVVFLQEGDDLTSSLYIVNAPKAGNPTYINYYDICYSSAGPRNTQVFLTYIQPWNILLVACSNSMEVGVLGTTETGETPLWKQYITPDEARIELPLTSDKHETYPIGFAFETGSTHQLIIAEKQIPVMPMIHILSTHGQLVSFDFLNFSQAAPGLCSPPRPAFDASGLGYFQPILIEGNANPTAPAKVQEPVSKPATDLSFALPKGATSTPAADRKPKSIETPPSNNLFGNLANQGTLPFGNMTANKPPTGVLFGATQVTAAPPNVSAVQTPTAFGMGQILGQKTPTTTTAFGGAATTGQPLFGTPFGQMPGADQKEHAPLPFASAKETPAPVVQTKTVSFGTQQEVNKPPAAEKTKPLYTVQPTYTVPQQKSHEKDKSHRDGDISADDVDTIKEITKTYVQQFEADLRDLSNRSKEVDITIGNIDETREVVKRLNEVGELSNQAVETTESLASDLQGLRNTLNECFVMLVETRSKLNMSQNPELPELATLSNSNQTNRRQIIKLRSLLAINEAQLQMISQQIDARWSNFQDIYKKSKTKMRIPSLEGVYQTLLKQKDILARERLKINYIKSRLGVKGTLDQLATKRNELTIESLADSILSMSLSDQVKADRSHLTEDKLKNLREILANRQIIEIKAQRPDRVGVKSEVVREMRIRMANQREGASTKPEKMEKQRIKAEAAAQQIAKPTPTKPATITKPTATIATHATKPQPVQLKTTPVTNATATQSPFTLIKPTATTPNNTFAAMASNLSLQKAPSTTPVLSFGGAKTGQPISFGNLPPPVTTSTPLLATPNEEPIKPVPIVPSGQGKPDLKTLPFQPKPITAAAKPIAEPTPFAPKTEASGTPFAFKPPAPAVETKTEQTVPAEKQDSKPSEAAPFAVLNFGQTPGSGFSFGSNTNNSMNSIFGGQSATATKPTPSIFGANGQTVTSSTPQPTTVAFSTPVTAGFTPLSVAGTQSTAGTTASPISSFSFLPKDTVDTSPAAATTASSFSFVSKPEASVTTAPAVVATSDSVKSQIETPPAGSISSESDTTVAAPTMASFNFGTFAKSMGVTITPSSSAEFSQPSAVVTSSADPVDSFDGLNICKPTAIATQGATATPNIGFGGSLFGSTAFASAIPSAAETKISFGATTTTPSVPETASPTSPAPATSVITTSIGETTITAFSTPSTSTTTFGSNAPSTPIASGPFGTAPAPTPATTPSFGSTPIAASAFGSPAPASTTSTSAFGTTPSVFGTPNTSVFSSGIPKPDQSVFGTSPVTSPVTSAAAPFGTVQASSPFGASPTAQPASGENLFSSASNAFGMQPAASTGGSIFGSASPAQQQQQQSSVFGGGQTTSSIFGGGTQPAQSGDTGYFGSSPFGDNTQQQLQSSIFGGGNGASTGPSGGGFSAPAFGQSPFGGAQQQQQQQSSPFGAGGSGFGTAGAFGSGGPAFGQTTGFGAPSSPGGSFAQAGQPSVAQSGFGSPGGFGKPAFGAQPTFGGAPTFGSSPTFGGAPTFGSPKSAFGTFGQPAPVTFSPPTQKNSLFETLGSTDNGLSFGNLAQNTNNPNGAKQQFGGSSFSTWR